MDAQSIAKWMLQEHLRVDELVGRLRERGAAPQPAERAHWIEEVRDRFDHLRAHLFKHLAMEEDGGYMKSVLECRPTLSDQVEKLHREHREMVELMNSIHQAVHQATADDALLISDACARIQHFLSYLERHQESENLLTASVFTDDMGTWTSGG